MRRLVSFLIAGVLSMMAAYLLVPGVRMQLQPDSNFFGLSLKANWQLFLLLGLILGLLNYFIKPILDIITLPLKIITFGIFGFSINMILIMALDRMFIEFSAPWFWPLFYTTLVIAVVNTLVIIIVKKQEN